jgi:3-oxoacyl-[acyl-carrier-protein] synthase-3
MSQSTISGVSIRGIATSVPERRFDNVADATGFAPDAVRKVVAMAGVAERRIVDGMTCSSDLCFQAAETLLDAVRWQRESIDGLVFVTQTPDYFMPSSSCVLHKRLGLQEHCASFDLGLGCSGYIYGLWLASMMLKAGGLRRVLLLHGETPTRYAFEQDHATSLLFGDAGSATAVERDETDGSTPAFFTLCTDGSGYEDLIVEGGGFRDRFCATPRAHFVKMNGANVFNFTIKVIPPLIRDTLRLANRQVDEIDYYIFHQSNRFILQHLIETCGLPRDRVPVVLDRFGNSGGPSVPLTITQGLTGSLGRPVSLMLLGYGTGLSWGAALVQLPSDVVIRHVEYPQRAAQAV